MLFVFTAVIHVKAQKDIVVDPNAEERKISGSFNAIKVSGAIDVFLSQSDNEAIAVSAAEDRFKEGIKTIVENGKLKIYYDGEKNRSFKNMKLKVFISFTKCNDIVSSGASDITVIGMLKTDSLSIVLSGASDFKGAVKCNSLKMNLSGASDVKIEGTANTVKIESSGASDVKGYDLVTENCTAKASGASDINITVNKELNAQASGASDIFYKGTALIKNMHNSGASTVARKN